MRSGRDNGYMREDGRQQGILRSAMVDDGKLVCGDESNSLGDDTSRKGRKEPSAEAGGGAGMAFEGMQLGDLGRRLSSSINSHEFKFPNIELPEPPRLTALDYAIPDLSYEAIGVPTDWCQLIILGNGFDLQCGLRSKFSDFFKARSERMESLSPYTPEEWDELVADGGLTLWDFILEANADSPWCDIEDVIERWVLSASESVSDSSLFSQTLEFTKFCPFIGGSTNSIHDQGESNWEKGDHKLGDVARYIWALHPEIRSKGYTKESFMSTLRQELTKLEAAFSEYLKSEVENNDEYAKQCCELYRAIECDGKKTGEGFRSSTSVLSFNYTDQIESCFDGGEDGVCVNIHGKLGGEIIFGIDGKDCMDNSDAVGFTKTFRLMRRGGTRTNKLINTAGGPALQDATDIIKFYGHSLGKADYSYFQSLFDGVSLYEGKTVLVFYYPHSRTDRSGNDNDMRRTRLANRINELLVAYGTTLDNADHGKNLMHKLLLEGRLIIRGLQVD